MCPSSERVRPIEHVLDLFCCPECRGRLHAVPGHLSCATCGERWPIVNGIPRFISEPGDELARLTQQSFGYEWTHFSDWRQSGETNFQDYFAGLDLQSLEGARVLDAGCGMGRHARQIAPHVETVVAVDFSRAIDAAAENTADRANVACVQADLLRLPLADASFDYVYSLGVLHHVADTARALSGLVSKAKPGGRVRVYLYWKRHGWVGALLALVSAARRVTTRLPHPVLRVLCWLLSVALFGAVVLPYRLLTALGVRAHPEWPLYIYTRYPFGVLYNDQFDRFSAPLEKRYDADEVRRLLEQSGLTGVTVRAMSGWIGEGVRLTGTL